jgi:putative restriction endonuclease
MRASAKDARQELLRLVDKINVWKRNGERAPHKPLLFLRALALHCDNPEAAVAFRQIEDELSSLIRNYGPPRRSVHPEYPFWRLQHDGLWEVNVQKPLVTRMGNDDPLRTSLREANARGYLPKWVTTLLLEDSSLVKELAVRVLDAHFPTELHAELLRETGLARFLPIESRGHAAPREYWRSALDIYNHRCMISGLGARCADKTYGISPTLIRWPQAGGVFALGNTLVLSNFYRDLFVPGLITITPDMRLVLSDRAAVTADTAQFMKPHFAESVKVPSGVVASELVENLRWHNRQVFRGCA